MTKKAYPSDLSDTEWRRFEPLLPPPKAIGRPRTVDLRRVLNAIFYVVRSGCQWRMLPKDLGAWQTAYYYFRSWQKDGTWQQLNDTLRRTVRQRAGRDPEPSAAILDSQSAKTTEAGGPRGYDAGKKVNGRKRHILVDTLGLLLAIVVHTADLQDRDGAKLVLAKVRDQLPRLKLIWADGGYAGALIAWVQSQCGWVLEIVKRLGDAVGFQLLPHRWIVERTLGWLGRSRRLSKDYEERPECSESMVYIAMIRLMLRQLDRSPATSQAAA
ncbi:MAG: IS5 family transposase [Deltaproteobacteria bacterium]|nr:IS5 family transposase [Deltaproteobacteria bacterium]